MAHPSKWQYLPTEAINSASLAIDKMPVLEIVDLVLAEDRKSRSRQGDQPEDPGALRHRPRKGGQDGRIWTDMGDTSPTRWVGCGSDTAQVCGIGQTIDG